MFESHTPRTALKFALGMAVLLLLGACSNKTERDTKSGATVLYERAHKSMMTGDFNNAISTYESLEARYPFSNQAKQGQLDLIYAYYASGQMESVIDAATQFERENPIHPRVDYALYMHGLALFKGQQTRFQRWLRINPVSRPQLDAREAFSAFAQLIQRFPDSKYAADARQRMIFLRDQLAEHQNYIARYYLRRGAYIAALNRARFSLVTFDGAPAVEDSLKIMITAYQKLGMQDLARDTRRVLLESFPDAKVKPLKKKKKHWYKFW